MRAANTRFITVFLVIIFCALPFFAIGAEGDGVNILGNFKEQKDFEGQPLANVLSVVNEKQVKIENRLTSSFPFYSDILIINRNIDMAVNNLIFKEGKADKFRPVGNTNGLPVMINGWNDLLIWLQQPANENQNLAKITSQAALFNKIQKSLPQTTIALYASTDIWNSKAGETAKLIPEGDGTKYMEEFEDLLDPEVSFGYLDIPDIASYKRMFYASDHHWNMRGAYEAYLEILGQLSPSGELGKPLSGKLFEVEGVEFWGSRARMAALSTVKDPLTDMDIEYPEFTVLVNGKLASADFSLKPKYLEGKFDKTLFANHYTLYFHSEYAEIVYKNKEKFQNNLLIVGDSHADCMDKLLASHFQNTYFVNVSYWQKEYKKSFNITEYAKKNNITHILFLEGVNAILYNNGNVSIEVK